MYEGENNKERQFRIKRRGGGGGGGVVRKKRGGSHLV